MGCGEWGAPPAGLAVLSEQRSVIEERVTGRDLWGPSGSICGTGLRRALQAAGTGRWEGHSTTCFSSCQLASLWL